MNSAIFAASAGKPALRLELDEVDIVNSVLETSSNQSHTDEVLNPLISNDVRKLISMHDRGTIQAFEVKDTSYKAVLSLAKHLGSVAGISRHNGLTPELLAQAIKFVKSVPAEQVFLRFEVTDKKPTIPNFNPAHMCAYDADRSYGTDYLQIARRLTIYGSTSSVMSYTDLGTFLESGKRKCVVLYLGTQKNEDIEFLDPAHAMALDLVVTGLEQSEDVDELLAKADTILLHPEIVELQQEASAIQVMLTEFRNNLDPEDGKEIAKRLLELQNNLEELVDTDIPTEFMTPISELANSMLTDDMIKEIIEYYDLGTDAAAPSSVELETLQTAIDYIIADPTLSAEEQGQKILDLLQVGVPSPLEGGNITANQITVFLENLQAELIEKEISLPVPLLEQPAMWELEHSEKLADLILLLSSPDQREALKEALKNAPEGMEILEVLDHISETLNLGNIEKAVLIEKIHEALTTTTPENAVLTSDLLRVMTFTHDPELISLAPAPVQLSVCSFTIDTLPAQHRLAIEGVTEHIRQLTEGAIKVEFNPPQAIPSTDDSGITILSFLVQPAVLSEIAALPPEQIPEFIKGLSDPALKDHTQDYYEALQILKTIKSLRTENGYLPPDIAKQLSTLIPASVDGSQNTADAIASLLTKIEADPSVIDAIAQDSHEGIKIAEALGRISATLDLENTDPATLALKIHEVLSSTSPENAALTNDIQQIISLSISSPSSIQNEGLHVLETIKSTHNKTAAFETDEVQALQLVKFFTNPQSAKLPSTLDRETTFTPKTSPNLLEIFSLQSPSEIVSSQKTIEHHLELLSHPL